MGNLAINYYKHPVTITKDSIATTQLEIDEDVQEIIPYYVGGWIYLEDSFESGIGKFLLAEYKDKRSGIIDILPSTPIVIENIFEGFM